jgi:hypothetical protein
VRCILWLNLIGAFMPIAAKGSHSKGKLLDTTFKCLFSEKPYQDIRLFPD